MTMKVKNARKEIVYIGDLSMSVSERKTAIEALSNTIKKAKAKEISLDAEQIRVIEDLQKCILALRPVDPDADTKSKK